MKFNTKHPDGDSYHGVVLNNFRSYILIGEVLDFHFYCFKALPKKHIKSIRDNKYDKATTDILNFNNEVKKFKAPKWSKKCNNIEELLRTIKKKGIWPTIEVKYADEPERIYFFIGPVTSIEEGEASILCYGADGKWKKEYYFDIKEIFSITWGDKYSETFNDYMKATSKYKGD